MVTLKCKACRAPLNFADGQKVITCPYCDNVNTLIIPERADLYNRASDLRSRCEFDRAISAYENILRQDPQDAEAYFGLALCKYGIEYVEDPVSGERKPTCHRLSMTPLTEDPDFKKAVELADSEVAAEYSSEGRKIERILSIARQKAASGETYDIFISFKDKDSEGSRTEASVIAQDLYNRLTKNGYDVFFSRKSLKAGEEFEPVIYTALYSAKVMLLVATEPEQPEGVWVKNEWSRFLQRMQGESGLRLIPLYKNMDPEDLPREIRGLQGIDMSRIGFEQEVEDAVGRLIKKSTGHSEAGISREEFELLKSNLHAEPQVSVENLMERAKQELSVGHRREAVDLYDQVLAREPNNVTAHLNKMFIDMNSASFDDMINKGTPTNFTRNANYQLAKQCADPQTRAELEDYERQLAAAIEKYHSSAKKDAKSSFRSAAIRQLVITIIAIILTHVLPRTLAQIVFFLTLVGIPITSAINLIDEAKEARYDAYGGKTGNRMLLAILIPVALVALMLINFKILCLLDS